MRLRRACALGGIVVASFAVVTIGQGADGFGTAYAKFLQARFPGATGYSVCPTGKKARAANGGVWCQAEVHLGRTFHRSSVYAKVVNGRIVFYRMNAWSWTRRWSAYSARVIRSTDVPGVASVNGPYYDWAWIAMGAYDGWKKQRRSFSASGCDCGSFGFAMFYSFRCTTRENVVQCTNGLGDSMRYKPRTSGRLEPSDS